VEHRRTDRRERSLVATREIAAVLREIRELFAVPWHARDERWEERRAVTEVRKSALVAECEAIAIARSRQQDGPSGAHQIADQSDDVFRNESPDQATRLTLIHE
jgi:hypothetical protein